MLVLLSPSKTLDFSSEVEGDFSVPIFLDDSQILINNLKKLKKQDIANLMGLSDKLVDLNYQRYRDFTCPFTPENSRKAILTFRGDVYDGLDANSLSAEQLKFSNQVIRILSGLYGVLKPFDLMQSYRLEMGTKLKNAKGNNLYKFWGDKITDSLNAEEEELIVNLASNEYFKAVNKKSLKARLVTVAFKDYKNGQYKSLMLFVKRARGMMARYIVENKISDIEGLKSFGSDGYKFNLELSKGDELVFTRKK